MQHLREKPRPGTQLNLSRRLNKGLVGCWLFNEGSGIRAFDSSPYKNHGTLLNMAIPSCRSSQGLAFDGVDDYVDAGNAASLNFGTGNFTYSGWFKTTAAGIMNILAADPNTIVLKTINIYDGKARFIFRDTANNLVITTSILNYNNSIWHQIIGVRSGIYGYLYVDGLLAASSSNAATGSTDAGVNTQIGAQAGGTRYYFTGTIDEVRIWNRALNATEIQLLYMNPYNMFMNVHGES